MSIETDALGEPGLAPRQSLRGPLAYAISCFLIWGLTYGLLDVLNKHFQESLKVGKAQSTLLQIAYFGAYLLISVPAGQMLHRRGYKFGLVSGLVVTAVGAFLFIPSAEAASFPMFVGAMFVLAAGLCVLETSADTYVNVLGSAEHASRRLNLAQSFNALGVFIGPLVGGSLFFGGGASHALGGAERSVQLTYVVIGVLVLIYAFVLSRARLPEIAGDHAVAPGEENAPERSIWSHRHFVLGVITQALYVGAQVGIGAFFINLVTETWHGLSSQQGAFLLSVATAGYLAGRFATTALMLKVPPRVVLTAYGVINVGLCLLVAAGVEKVSAIALTCILFFEGAMFATIFTLGVAGLGRATKRGSSLMVMAIGVGGVALPYPMGRIAEAFGTPAAFLLPAACFALVALYGWLGARVQEIPSPLAGEGGGEADG